MDPINPIIYAMMDEINPIMYATMDQINPIIYAVNNLCDGPCFYQYAIQSKTNETIPLKINVTGAFQAQKQTTSFIDDFQ